MSSFLLNIHHQAPRIWGIKHLLHIVRSTRLAIAWGWGEHRASLVAQTVKKKSAQYCRRLRFNLWVRKIPWRRKWQPTPVFLPGEFHEQRSLAGYSPWGSQRVRHDWVRKDTIKSIHLGSVDLELGNITYITDNRHSSVQKRNCAKCDQHCKCAKGNMNNEQEKKSRPCFGSIFGQV